MTGPPSVFTRATAAFGSLVNASGLVQVRTVFDEAAFGSAFAEYRGTGRALRLVWDGKDSTLLAEARADDRWIDVEFPVSGKAPDIDHDQSGERIARVLQAATEVLSRIVEGSIGTS